MDELRPLLTLARETAQQAGSLLLTGSQQGKIIQRQEHHDIKLAADKMSEAMIIECLKKQTDFPILCEESGWVGSPAKGRYWVVDPLDGTINYWRGIPFFCVSIALWEQQRPLGGAVYDPYRQEMFSGLVGEGAWLNGSVIRVSQTQRKEEAILLTGFPAQTDLSAENLDQFVDQAQKYRKLRWLGSAALSLAYVACGRADAYHEKNTNLWDVAAAIAIVMAAGGKAHYRLTDDKHMPDVFASNGLIENGEKDEGAFDRSCRDAGGGGDTAAKK